MSASEDERERKILSPFFLYLFVIMINEKD